MKNKLKTIISACIVIVMFFSLNVYAKNSKEQIADAQKEADKKKEQLEEAQNEVDDLESSKAKLEGNLASLNAKLETLSNEMTQLENDLLNKEQEIEAVQIRLEEAQKIEVQQYESMKMRIKYLYELGGDGSLLQSMIESGSFVEILNKADYYSKITQYDRKMLQEYQIVKDKIAEDKELLQQDKVYIETVLAQKETKQDEIQKLVSETSKEIADQIDDIQAAEAKALEYEKELEAQNNTIENLQAQLSYEESLKNNSSSSNNTSNRKSEGGNNYNIVTSKDGYANASSSGDLDVMAAIIYCEAGGEPYQGQLAVGSVIMNRINSSGFPDTLLGVLYQKSQFTPVMSGRFAVVLSKRLATDSCYAAAAEVLNGTNVVPDCLYFRTVIGGIQGQIIGSQIFY